MEPKVYSSERIADVGVAEVLANWQNVFRAINLATGMQYSGIELMIVKLGALGGGAEEEERNLPEMLVRIPVTDPKPEDEKS
jgi:hypothetical protein